MLSAKSVARRVGLAAILLSVLAGDGMAQDAATVERATREAALAMLGTVSVVNTPVFTSGQLSGCTLVFSAFAQDWIYKQGTFIKVDGNFGLMSVKGKFAVTLKVVLHDFDPRTMKFSPSPPASAYFLFGNLTSKSAIVASSHSDTPGAIFVV